MPRRSRPVLIAIVGIDGSGKTTQARRLAARLRADGLPARYFENAGGRPVLDGLARRLGKENGRSLVGARGVVASEMVIRGVAMARAMTWARVTGGVAVMDRYACCQCAIMGARHDAGTARVRRWFRRFPPPDLTVFLAVPPALAQARVAARGYDLEELEHLAGFDRAYRALPEFSSFAVVDGTSTTDTVQAALEQLARRAIERNAKSQVQELDDA